MRNKPSAEYSHLLENLSKEKRKRVNVPPAKSLNVKVKHRTLLFLKTSSSEGEGNGVKMPKLSEKKEVSNIGEVTSKMDGPNVSRDEKVVQETQE